MAEEKLELYSKVVDLLLCAVTSLYNVNDDMSNYALCFWSTSFATTSPLIKLGGTPGPGTVNWPV